MKNSITVSKPKDIQFTKIYLKRKGTFSHSLVVVAARKCFAVCFYLIYKTNGLVAAALAIIIYLYVPPQHLVGLLVSMVCCTVAAKVLLRDID